MHTGYIKGKITLWPSDKRIGRLRLRPVNGGWELQDLHSGKWLTRHYTRFADAVRFAGSYV